MPYDVELAERVRSVVGAEPGVAEKRMFGGLAFLVDGHLAVSASSTGGLLVRVDPRLSDDLLAAPHVHRLTMRGREMAGWLQVDADGVADDDALRRWVAHGLSRARSRPPRATVPA